MVTEVFVKRVVLSYAHKKKCTLSATLISFCLQESSYYGQLRKQSIDLLRMEKLVNLSNPDHP